MGKPVEAERTCDGRGRINTDLEAPNELTHSRHTYDLVLSSIATAKSNPGLKKDIRNILVFRANNVYAEA